MDEYSTPTSTLRDLIRKNWWQPVVALVVGGTALFLVTIIFSPAKDTVADTGPVAIENTLPALPAGTPDAYQGVRLEAQSAIVYDLTTKQILYARGAEQQRPLASLTKLLTIYAASDALTASSSVTMTPTALAQVGDLADIGFKSGETFKYADIARLALVSSSNTAAAAIAEAASAAKATQGTELLAGAAASAGLTQTYANNGTGLDESTTVSGGYGSAHDVALLAAALLAKAPEIAHATTETSITVTSIDGIRHTLSNTDPDIIRFPSPLLSKTGYTDLAGGNLVVVYDAGINHPVAIAVLDSTRDGRFTDVQTLMKATLAHFAGISVTTVPATSAASVSVRPVQVPNTDSVATDTTNSL